MLFKYKILIVNDTAGINKQSNEFLIILKMRGAG